MGRPNKSHIRKKEILAACYEVIANEGFDNTTFAKIADHMEVTAALLVHYFGSKENMFLEMVDYMFKDQAETILSLVEGKENPEERIITVIEYYLSDEFESRFDNNVYYGCFYLSLRKPAIKERFQRILVNMDRVLHNEIKRYLEAREKTHIDPDTISFYLDALLEGADFQAAMGIDRINRRERIKQIRRLIYSLLDLPGPSPA